MKDDNNEIWSLSKLGNVLGVRYFIRSSKSRGWRVRVEGGGIHQVNAGLSALTLSLVQILE